MNYEELAQEIMQKISIIHNIPEHRVLYSFNKGEMRLLFVLSQGPLTPGEISSKLQISSALTAKLIRQLCFKGLVRRNLNIHDRRSFTISLTPKGESEVTEAYGQLSSQFVQLLKQLGEVDSFSILRIMDRIIDIYSGKEQDND